MAGPSRRQSLRSDCFFGHVAPQIWKGRRLLFQICLCLRMKRDWIICDWSQWRCSVHKPSKVSLFLTETITSACAHIKRKVWQLLA
jgi:hypothetical protein